MTKYIIPNLRNACRVLTLLSEQRAGLPLADIARRLEIPRTTALRIATTLTAEGIVEQVGRRYVLGPMLIQLGTRAMENLDLRTIAIPVLRELSRETQETAHLAVPAGDKALLLEVCDSPLPVRVASRPGTLADIHCSATGKVFLAFRHDDLAEFLEGKELIRRTENTRTTVEQQQEEAERTRERGYAVDNEEYSLGVRCLAAPVYDSFGKVVAAIGITASTSSFSKRLIPAVARSVTTAASSISKTLGA
ncbi:MAG: IclR family transcriptional regulator [Planctomycetota bacterium]